MCRDLLLPLTLASPALDQVVERLGFARDRALQEVPDFRRTRSWRDETFAE